MNQRILMVDSAKSLYERLSIIHKNIHYSPNFKNAYHLFDQNQDPLDLLVTETIDVRQSDISLKDLVYRIREVHEPSYLPIIAFTNRDSRETLKDIAEYLRLDIVIQKPRNQLLYRCIEELLLNPHAFEGNTQFHFYEKGLGSPNVRLSLGSSLVTLK